MPRNWVSALVGALRGRALKGPGANAVTVLTGTLNIFWLLSFGRSLYNGALLREVADRLQVKMPPFFGVCLKAQEPARRMRDLR